MVEQPTQLVPPPPKKGMSDTTKIIIIVVVVLIVVLALCICGCIATGALAKIMDSMNQYQQGY